MGIEKWYNNLCPLLWYFMLCSCLKWQALTKWSSNSINFTEIQWPHIKNRLVAKWNWKSPPKALGWFGWKLMCHRSPMLLLLEWKRAKWRWKFRILILKSCFSLKTTWLGFTITYKCVNWWHATYMGEILTCFFHDGQLVNNHKLLFSMEQIVIEEYTRVQNLAVPNEQRWHHQTRTNHQNVNCLTIIINWLKNLHIQQSRITKPYKRKMDSIATQVSLKFCLFGGKVVLPTWPSQIPVL